jgi:hypothetical protein
MKTSTKKTGAIIIALLIAGAVAAAPAFAGMGGGSDQGSGSGGNSGSGMGSSMEGEDGRQGMGNGSGSQMTNSEDSRVEINSMPMISTGGLGSGDMTMDVTPVKYKDGRLEVKYYANTHSVSLGKYDLMELSTLEVNGKIYKPVKADRMRGHHSGGRIVFEVPERPDQFRIVIRDIPTVEERYYVWN